MASADRIGPTASTLKSPAVPQPHRYPTAAGLRVALGAIPVDMSRYIVIMSYHDAIWLAVVLRRRPPCSGARRRPRRSAPAAPVGRRTRWTGRSAVARRAPVGERPAIDLRPGARAAGAARRRPRGDPGPARRGAAQRLPADAGAGAAQPGRVAAELGLGVPDAVTAGGRGPDRREQGRVEPGLPADRARQELRREAQRRARHALGGRELGPRSALGGDEPDARDWSGARTGDRSSARPSRSPRRARS